MQVWRSSANVSSPGTLTKQKHQDQEALSHERTMSLMRFGSVVVKWADLSRALETITMPLGMWLKDLLVYERASLDVFRNWRCLLVTLYYSCCTANCKEKNNTYNTPEKKKKSEWEGQWSIFHVSFLIHIQIVSADISNMLSNLLCASFSVFVLFVFLVITVISVNEYVGSVCK